MFLVCTVFKKRLSRVFLFAGVAVVVLLVQISATELQAATAGAPVQNEAATGATQVTTVAAKQANWPLSVPAQGEIVPWEEMNLSAKTNGIGAVEIAVVEGDSVRKGQVLARFDERLLRAELAQAKANLAFAQANFQLAANNLKRSETLKSKQLVSEQDYELVANQAATAAAVKDQSAAALSLAEIKLADATITAPDDGKILQRNIDLGQVPNTGAVLFRLARQHKLEWIAQVDAQSLAQIKPAMSAQINTQMPPPQSASVTGSVRSTSSLLAKNSRLGTVRVLLDGAPTLPVNSYVEGKIIIGQRDVIIVPANCLVIKDGKTWLFRLNKNTAEQVLVGLGQRLGEEIEILNGIQAGDVIVQDGAGFLNSGDKVVVVGKNSVSSAAAGAQ